MVNDDALTTHSTNPIILQVTPRIPFDLMIHGRCRQQVPLLISQDPGDPGLQRGQRDRAVRALRLALL